MGKDKYQNWQNNFPQEVTWALQEREEENIMIICPLTSDECPKRIIPRPKDIFIMMPSMGKQPDELKPIIVKVQEILRKYSFTHIEGPGLIGLGDYLCSICQHIQGAAFGIAFVARGIAMSTLCNIFWEKGLMEGFGKYVMLIADQKDSLPTNFVRESTIFYEEPGWESKFNHLLSGIMELPNYYTDVVGNSALEADDIEKASKYFIDAYMIAGELKYEQKIDNLIDIVQSEKFKVAGFKQRILENLKVFKKGIHLK